MIKLIRKNAVWVYLFTLVSCNQLNEEPLISLYEYEQLRDSISQAIQITSHYKLKLIIKNNPYEFKDSDKLVLYVNNYPVISDKFSMEKDFNIEKSKLSKRVSIRMIILKKDGKQYLFENKNNFIWKEEYNFIYVFFLPDNSAEEVVCFCPQEFPLEL